MYCESNLTMLIASARSVTYIIEKNIPLKVFSEALKDLFGILLYDSVRFCYMFATFQ